MADRVPSALPYRSTGYIVHGIKRRSSSYNHPRLEHIMEEGTQRAKARSIVRLCRFAPAARSGPLARAPMPVASPRARYPETRQTSPRRRSYPGTPLTRARYAASDADGRAHPPSSTRGLFPAFLAASSPRDASTRSTTRACEKTKQATPTARTSSCTTAT